MVPYEEPLVPSTADRETDRKRGKRKERKVENGGGREKKKKGRKQDCKPHGQTSCLAFLASLTTLQVNNL